MRLKNRSRRFHSVLLENLFLKKGHFFFQPKVRCFHTYRALPSPSYSLPTIIHTLHWTDGPPITKGGRGGSLSGHHTPQRASVDQWPTYDMVHDNEKLRWEKMRPRHIPYCLTTLAAFHTSLQDRGGADIFFTSLTRTTMQIGFKKKI